MTLRWILRVGAFLSVVVAACAVHGAETGAGAAKNSDGTAPASWRTHPDLQGKFHAAYPDDLQVIVHDGGPRFTERQPEAVWVTVTGVRDDVFTGRVLNVPHQLQTVRQGQTIRFVGRTGAEHPVMVSEKYLAERAAWIIHPCRKCGLTVLFDAPSDMMKKLFPKQGEGEVMEMFTAFCPLCRDVQVIEAREKASAEKPPTKKRAE